MSQYYTLTTYYGVEKYDHRKALRYAGDVRELLIDSIRLRLRADVPVGTCLSGGLDSSAVVTIMSRLLGTDGGKLNTFTASFPAETFDESRFARSVAQRAGVQSCLVYPTKEGYPNEIARVLYHQDEPFGGASIYSEWSVMGEASKHVKVILDGHGGDEVFAGYKDYRLAFLAELRGRRKWLTFGREFLQSARMHSSKRAFVKRNEKFADVRARPKL